MGFVAIGTALGASAASAAAVGAAAVSAAVGVVSAGATYASQAANAKAQAEHQAKKNDAITEATIENYKELDKVEQDALYNAGQDSLENQITALETASQVEAAASATGVRGGSNNMMMRDIARRKSVGDTDVRMARDQQLKGADAQARSLQRGAEASYDYTPIQKPSVWTSLAKGASDGAGMYNTMSGFTSAMSEGSKATRKTEVS